jgi:hypothetical protein
VGLQALQDFLQFSIMYPALVLHSPWAAQEVQLALLSMQLPATAVMATAAKEDNINFILIIKID